MFDNRPYNARSSNPSGKPRERGSMSNYLKTSVDLQFIFQIVPGCLHNAATDGYYLSRQREEQNKTAPDKSGAVVEFNHALPHAGASDMAQPSVARPAGLVWVSYSRNLR